MAGDRFVVAVDAGGTRLKFGTIGVDAVGGYSVSPTPADPADLVDAIAAVIEQAAAGAARAPSAVGVAVPGIVDEGSGIVVGSETFGFQRLALRDELSARFPFPVVVRHDVRSGARAEARFGAAAETVSAMFVAIGTGIAATLLIDGEVYSGAANSAGEIGQIVVRPSDASVEQPAFATAVTLEQVASARAIARDYAERSAQSVSGADEVARLVGAGDDAAATVWYAAVDQLAEVIGDAVVVFDPEVVVLGGGLAQAGDLLAVPLAQRLEARAPWRRMPPLVRAHLADRAGFVGAGLAAWETFGAAGELTGAVESFARSVGPDVEARP